MEQIISTKIRYLIKPYMAETQTTFRPGRSVHGYIFTIQLLVETKKQHRQEEYT